MEIKNTKVNLYLDVQLWRKIKAQAALQGKTLSEYVSGILEREVNKK